MKPFSILIVSAFCFTLPAADSFWAAKPYTAWSDAEVHQFMLRSPWAREVLVSDVSVGMAQQIGNVPSGSHGHSANFSSVSPAGVTTTGAKIKAVVFWESALPARQALARVKFGAEAGQSGEARDFIGQEGISYVLVVTGLPAALVKQTPEELRDGLAAKSSLAVKGRPPVQPSKAEVFADGKSFGMYFEFPRSLGITVDDKEVNFSTRLGEIDVKSAFHPPEMVLSGKLEL
jgi:hypothetical protein